MSLKNLLDLRKKVSPQVQIIEKIIFQKRSWKREATRTLLVAVIATSVIWGVSKADILTSNNTQTTVSKNFSAIGIVSSVSTTTLSIQDAHGSDNKTQTSYIFSTDSITKIETKSYVPLTLSDINVGDKIVVQGVDMDGVISIKRIISFSVTAPKEVVGTTTPEVIATSTATTTEATTTNETGTTTPTITDKIGDFVNNIVDSIMGTSTKESASTTPDTSSSTEQVSSTTEETSTSTPPTIVEKVIEVVTNAVNTVVDAVTPDPKPETPAPTEVTPPTPETPPTPDAPVPTGDSPPTTTN